MATRYKIIHTGNRGSEINALTEKTTPVDADMVGLMDSAASNVLKKLSWANIKATLKTYFDTLYILQIASTLTTSIASGSTTIPFDDTIPQNTEGNEFMTCAITPKSASSKLIIEAVIYLAHETSAANLIAALFQDTTANALAVSCVYQTTASGVSVLTIRHVMTAGTTSETTFKVRGGSPTAGNVHFNTWGVVTKFGAITKSSIVITEVRV